MKRKIRELRTSNPKEFWKIINSKDRKKKVTNVNLDELFDFFKDLNTDQNDDIPDHVLSDEELEMLSDIDTNAYINQPISPDEIMHCIKLLKLNKSSGIDNIVNEYIKSTANVLLPLYTKLFNIIFETGIFPTQWLCGEIIPIYKNKGDEMDPKNYRPITLLYCLLLY